MKKQSKSGFIAEKSYVKYKKVRTAIKINT